MRHLHWLAPRYYDTALGRMISSIHSWMLRTPRRVILVDTCTGNHKSRPGWAFSGPTNDRSDRPKVFSFLFNWLNQFWLLHVVRLRRFLQPSQIGV
jgi:hypothetical protein